MSDQTIFCSVILTKYSVYYSALWTFRRFCVEPFVLAFRIFGLASIAPPFILLRQKQVHSRNTASQKRLLRRPAGHQPGGVPHHGEVTCALFADAVLGDEPLRMADATDQGIAMARATASAKSTHVATASAGTTAAARRRCCVVV